MTPASFWSGTRQTVTRFFSHQPFMLAASLSFYTLLSLAPLLLIVLAAAGLIFGEGAVREELVHQVREVVGERGAEAVDEVIENANRPGTDTISMIVGVATLLFGATTVFAQLQAALNQIWGVEARPGNAVWGFLKDRLLSLAMIFGIGFLLLVSLVVSAVIAGMQNYINTRLPGGGILTQALNLLISIGVITVLIALVFKYLPDAKIAWRDVWVGAFITTVLFSIGKLGIGLYLGQASVGSSYGAAGSLVILLVWVYYASLIFFFGAEITRTYADRVGEQVRPSAHAAARDDATKPT